MSANRPTEFVTCPRCSTPLEYGGTKRFHEGTRFWDFMGGVFELLKGRMAFDLYVCPRCGRVEFFADGIGEELRGETAEPRNILLEPPEKEPAPAGEWRCPCCDEAVPAAITVCWKCNAERPAD